MFVRRFQKFLFAGALLAVAPLLAGADEPKKLEMVPAPKKEEVKSAEHMNAPAVTSTSTPGGCGTVVSSAPASGPCGPSATPVYTTVRETVMVPEQYTTTRTVNKKETREESYTAYKYETVSETKTRNVTVYRNVTETVMEPRTTTVKVPVHSTVTEMVTRLKIEKYTEMVSKTVDKGHYVTQEVPAGPGLLDCLSAMRPKFGGFGKHRGGCSDPCADPCATSCAAPACAPACPAPVKMKCVKVWVPNCVTECHPVCKTRCVKECVPCTKQVCTYKCETKCEMVPVCKTRCVPECKTETYTECRKVCVPYTAKRCVEVCVPVTENVTCTRMVSKVVEKQVLVDPAPCGPTAGDCGPSAGACDPCATAPCMSMGGKLKGLFGKFGGKKSCCN